MHYRHFVLAALICAAPGIAQTVPPRDAGTVARDIRFRPVVPEQANAQAALPVVAAPRQNPAMTKTVLIGAVEIEGARDIPRAAFASAIADYLGRDASAQDMQGLARSIASVARAQGYVFASAIVPPQTVRAGTITVRIDEGQISTIRIIGSTSARLRKTLDPIVGAAVRRDVLERQLLLAGDIAGIEIVGTRLARENAGSVLIVEVRERRGEGAAAIDNSGSRALGPVRARLRYEFVGLASDDDVIGVQGLVTPADPSELTFVSGRYSVLVGIGGTQAGVTAAVGYANPQDTAFKSTSRYIALFTSTPLQRANHASVWANAEIGILRVDGRQRGLTVQRDSLAIANLSLYATTRMGTGRVSGSIGVTRGLGLPGTTKVGDPRASRFDGSAQFTKGTFWADWIQPVGNGIALKVGANGQVADRPLLSAQEIGLGGPWFGRAFDFSTQFGDSGFMGSAELRWRRAQPVRGVAYVEPYVFVDAGRVWNRDGGFGDGDLASSGGGVRMSFGKLDFAIEGATPVALQGTDLDKKSVRFNLAVGRRF